MWVENETSPSLGRLPWVSLLHAPWQIHTPYPTHAYPASSYVAAGSGRDASGGGEWATLLGQDPPSA